MATVKMTYGTGTCQHVHCEITIDGEARRYSMLRDELIGGEVEQDRKFQAVLTNIKTDIKLDGKTDMSAIVAKVNAKEFKE